MHFYNRKDYTREKCKKKMRQ